MDNCVYFWISNSWGCFRMDWMLMINSAIQHLFSVQRNWMYFYLHGEVSGSLFSSKSISLVCITQHLEQLTHRETDGSQLWLHIKMRVVHMGFCGSTQRTRWIIKLNIQNWRVHITPHREPDSSFQSLGFLQVMPPNCPPCESWIDCDTQLHIYPHCLVDSLQGSGRGYPQLSPFSHPSCQFQPQ